MKQVNEAISDLLLRHNCVIIPNFGGFIANVLNAQIDLNKGKIEAPKKALTFNTNLINNDGLLANYLSEVNASSFDDASLNIKLEVEAWKKTLNAGERVEIERVGYLYYDKEKNLNFEQDRFFNLLLSSYGLSDLNFVQQKEEELVVETEKVETIRPTIEEEKETPIIQLGANLKKEERSENKEPVKAAENKTPKKRRSIWKYAAAAAILPFAFYSFWIPLKTDVLESGILVQSDFNPFTQSEMAKYEASKALEIERVSVEKTKSLYEIMEGLPEGVNSYTFSLDEYTHFTVLKDAPVEESNTSAEEKEILGSHLIAGCFSEESNANSLVKDMKSKGFDAFILDKHKGLYRVSIAQFSDLDKAITQKKQLKQSGISTWLLNL